eukprot:5860665-Prymnesium_polylepis.1
MHRGDRWTVGEAGTGVTETESKQGEERWPRHDPGDVQTHYPGELGNTGGQRRRRNGERERGRGRGW